ncbi:MAG: sulfatase-like hydrolase/transferase [Alphaproteobacteria bacterium]|nr:sulfatase-like hydrolase/transferase [Alphaproteobacteria bacterium]MBU1548112.1 sulfatase-like hydrolase/transferase [Alphaproteobacteria bacterium]MBU2336126.1 sulfatase-like hydrolase/transferase [Alphaproteobacteria bacterium]MBU2390479.1 sulfatase-like hydrolase/transferase [Alphaproteobacteria bacterium]
MMGLFARAHADSLSHSSAPRANAIAWLRMATALLLAFAVLALPSNPAALARVFPPNLPLEILGLAVAALLLPGKVFRVLRAFATALFATILFLKLADLGTGSAFQRPFNPYLDLKIMTDGWNLLSGSIGRAEAAVFVSGAILLWLALSAVFFWALGGFRSPGRPTALGLAAAAALALLAGLATMSLEARALPVSADVAPYLTNRIAMIRQSVVDLAAFETELKSDPAASIPPDQRLSRLTGTDVVFIFVESYGRSAIEDAQYAPRVATRLSGVAQAIAGAGLEARSGWLTAPTVGGLSWLAHGALLSGLWTDSQARYDRMIASERPTLNALFRQAGWHTTAIMPAITMDWPESGYFGYDTVRDASGLGYRGKPFNWVTMPDQYTLSAFQKMDRDNADKPVMAEIALISSHAPWTPIPTLVDWEKIGDGRIFDEQAEAGDPPSVVWSDPARIREQYLASIDYALETLGSYVSRYGDNTLFVILGDHQPASVITGEGASRDVPVHIIGSPAMIEQLSSWEWTEGLVPASSLAPMRMDLFRERFLRTFSGPA